METFHPTLNRILVLPDPAAEKSEGGLHLAEVAQEIPVTGTVIRIGPDVSTVAGLIRGSRVIYGKYSGTEITLDKVKHLVLTEKDVLGILWMESRILGDPAVEAAYAAVAPATPDTPSPIDTAPAGAL